MAVKGTMITAEVAWVEIEALKNILDQVETLINTTVPLPENRTARCLELLGSAKAMADHWKRPPTKH
jgi:hypothetical protein